MAGGQRQSGVRNLNFNVDNMHEKEKKNLIKDLRSVDTLNYLILGNTGRKTKAIQHQWL